MLCPFGALRPNKCCVPLRLKQMLCPFGASHPVPSGPLCPFEAQTNAVSLRGSFGANPVRFAPLHVLRVTSFRNKNPVKKQ